MSDNRTKKEQRKDEQQEKRSYFRINDIIPVIVNPLSVDREKSGEILESISGSRAYPLSESSGSKVVDADHISADFHADKKLDNVLMEIKAKLDFIINHLVLDREGLFSAEKKQVNISASGMKFVMNEPVKQGDVMEVKFLLPTYPPVAVFAYGRVTRVKEQKNGQFETAIEYVNMSETVRNEIIQYTLSQQREERQMKKEADNT